VADLEESLRMGDQAFRSSYARRTVREQDWHRRRRAARRQKNSSVAGHVDTIREIDVRAANIR
jgi:hypothetical protein